MRVERPRNDRAPRGAAKVARPPALHRAPPQFVDPSGVVDLVALMGGQPNGLEEALANVKASGRASRLFDARVPISLAPIDVSAWTSHPTTTEAPRASRRRPWGAALAIVIAGLLVGAYLRAPDECRRILLSTLSRIDAAVAALSASPPPAVSPSPSPASSPREPTVLVAVRAPSSDPPPAAPPTTIDAPPVITTTPLRTPPAEKEIRNGRHGRQAARASARFANASRTRAPDASPATPGAAIRSAPASPTPTKALDSAIREAAGPPTASASAPDDIPAIPAVAATTSMASADATRPDRPSGSAVASAITQVLPAARACLGDVPDPSRATISFGPDGSVQKIDVTGPAAASSKMVPCLRSTLGRAHVPPFAQSSYTASVTVRPL